MSSFSNKAIIIIGAGVTGLSTALCLMQEGYKNVTVMAKYIPGDMSIEYTSPFAGAHWRTMAKNDDQLLKSFDAITYEKFMNLAETEGNLAGIMVLPSYDYYDDDTIPEIYDPWFKSVVRDFKFLTAQDGLPEGAKLGHSYTTLLINTPVYLKWLVSQIEALGGKIVRHAFSHINEVFDFIDSTDNAAVINCTGLGARFLGGIQDQALFPTRGQTIVAKAPHIKKTLTHIGSDHITYIIPRSDGTVILGGTANKHDFNPFSDGETNKDIIKRTTELCPELLEHGPIEIVRYASGLRPTRVGGPRIENEIITSADQKKSVKVTHAYGHGGFGVQSSWGSAEHVVKVMESGFATKARL